MNPTPKVAHIVFSLTQSDLKNLISALVYKQKEKGIEADIIHIVPENQTSMVLKIRGIDIFTYTRSNGMNIRLMFKLSKFLRANHYNVVHTHSHEVAALAAAAAKLSGAKAIYSSHWITDSPVPALAKQLNNHIVTACEYIQTQMFGEGVPQNRKYKIIYDGIDEHMYMKSPGKESSKENRHKLGLREDSFIIGNIGPLIKEEDQATLIKAFKKLQSKGLDAELVFAGEGPLLNDLKKMSANYDLVDHIKFVPQILSRAEYLQLFDVMVHTANKETYPFNLLEAMASGTPVIATKIGANEEVIDERKTGYIVPCGFPERIDSAIMRLNAIKTLPQEMGEHSREHIVKNFTINLMAEKYQELYTS
ncbi:MAG: glycosyltransferase [Candidatus Omnitrophica bacterium]|nr:glycosyltransferase [Candidatus Omnitrophota bacterium]